MVMAAETADVLQWLFWGAAAVVAYAAFGYPLVMMFRSLLVRRSYDAADIAPHASMIIAAHNEADGIAAKLENALSLDYPPGCLEIIVASDGSDDGTQNIVSRYADRGVRLLALPRRGKAAALNDAVKAAKGIVLVFSDATSLYAPGALRALMRPLADPTVGGVAGRLVYHDGHTDGHVDHGEHLHCGLDQRLKQLGSRSSSAIAASGAIYAIRRQLFEPVPEGVTDDFVISTRVIAKGYRLVFAPDAVAYDPVTDSSSAEFGRKVRVITRGLRSVIVMRSLLNPFRHGFYALQLFSQKIVRRLVVFPLLLLLVVSPLLWQQGLVYRAATLGQLLFYSLAAFALAARRTRFAQSKHCTIPFYFCLVNAASLWATFNLLRGNRIVVWEPARQPSEQTAASGLARLSSKPKLFRMPFRIP